MSPDHMTRSTWQALWQEVKMETAAEGWDDLSVGWETYDRYHELARMRHYRWIAFRRKSQPSGSTSANAA